ncbi:hypothetical protein CERSUDRAFT_95061 [Gelatoporia subvermispora B]|uniref:NACHT domain-containing protein n=1 Tax=Ceriporiopsis subvermispora (strain B) TaxID=914234 RepID=M2QXE1_CERS8|nr:hypothetical protein CERSUDRAFT_95061 [Gelatoporia subvermispora B]
MRNPKAVKQLSDRDEPADAALSTAIDVVGVAECATSNIPVPGLGAAFSALDVLLHKVQDMKSNTQEAQDTIHNIESLRLVLESSTTKILDQTRYIDDIQRQRMLRQDSASEELRVRIDKLSKELGTLGKLAEKLPKKRCWMRLLFTQQHAELLQRINRRVTEAKGRFQVHGDINIEQILGEMCELMKREEHERLLRIHSDILEKLNPADASYRSSAADEKSRLLPGTRKEILRDLHDWATSDDTTKRIYVLHGSAGIGKSSVAYAFSKSIEDGQLGATWFFNHGIDECKDPQRVIPTLVYQIARHSHEAMRHIVDAVQKHLPEGRNQSLEYQVRELLEGPLCRLNSSLASTVLVLDGFDECSNVTGMVPLLLKLLCRAAHTIPSLRILIVTRPESYILTALQSNPYIGLLKFRNLEDVAAGKDIAQLLEGRLRSGENGLLPLLVARPEAIEKLTILADGLFIYAETVLRFLEQDPFFAIKSYDRLISSNGVIPGASTKPDRLAILYSTILKNAFEEHFHDAVRMEGTCKVLAWITHPRNDFSASKLAEEGISVDMTRDVVNRLRSVLRIEGDPMDTKATFGLYHLSLTQFLLDKARFTEPDLPMSKAVGIIAFESLNKILLECRTYLGPWDDPKSTVNVQFRPLRLLKHVKLEPQIDNKSKCELILSTGLSAESWVDFIRDEVQWSNRLQAELLSMAKARWTDWMLLCVQYASRKTPNDVVSWDDGLFQWMIVLEVWYMEHDDDGELSKIIEEAHAQAKREEERLTNRQSTWDINDRSSHYEGARRRLSGQYVLRGPPNAAERLAKVADGIFIFAAIALRYIVQERYHAIRIYDNIVDSAQDISDNSGSDRIYILYGRIMDNAFENYYHDSFRMDGLSAVMTWIRGPGGDLSAAGLAEEDIPVHVTQDIVMRLRSVLKITGDPEDPDTEFRPCHSSFLQFLFQSQHSCFRLPIKTALPLIAIRACHKIILECRAYVQSLAGAGPAFEVPIHLPRYLPGCNPSDIHDDEDNLIYEPIVASCQAINRWTFFLFIHGSIWPDTVKSVLLALARDGMAE